MRLHFIIFLIAGLFLLKSPGALGGICSDGKEADGITRVGGNGYCMAILTNHFHNKSSASPLIIVLHGDGAGKVKGLEYFEISKKLAIEFSTPTILMLRPGYLAPFGKSDGPTSYDDDSYSGQNVDYLSYALSHLKILNPMRKFVLVGHSGGAAMVALLVARYPKLVDAAVIAGCPCDVQSWRRWRKRSVGRKHYWPNSLSPLDFVKRVSKKAIVIAVSGDQDGNALPRFAKAYVQKLIENGVHGAKFISAIGANHLSVLYSAELQQAIRDAFDKAQR